MGREVRKVPQDWQHPKNESGGFIPLHDRGILKYEDADTPVDERIAECELMPDFGDSATHFQMYEDTTEGTPISPVCETPEELATWLADNNASAFGSSTATRESWLRMIYRGWAPSCVLDASGLHSGVDACCE